MANTIHTVITTGGGDYTSLNAYEDAIDGTAYGAGETATVNCSGTDADTTAVTFAGWDADVTVYVNGDYAVTSGDNWSNSYYHLSGNVQTNGYYFVFTKIQLSGELNCAYYARGNSIWNRCLFYSQSITANPTSGSTAYFYNCIFKRVGGDNYGDIIYSGSTDCQWRFWGCTIDASGLGNGINDGISGNNIDVRNTVAINPGSGRLCFYNTTNWVNCTNNATDDNSAPGSNYQRSIDATVEFVTEGSDYHIDNATSVDLLDLGVDLSGSLDSAYEVDIDGEARGATWDIGADEYVAAGGGEVTPYGYLSTNKGFW